MMKMMRLGCGVMLLFLTVIAHGHGELQLRNFTPTIKTVNISLQGAQSVMPHLERVYDLISRVLQSSKLHVVRVPTTEDPMISMVIPMVESLDINISMPTPDDINVQSYVFNLRTKLSDKPEENQSFTYFPDDTNILYQTLQDYFTKLLNLQVTVLPALPNGLITNLDSPENDVTQTSGIQHNLSQDIDPHPVISDVLNTQRVVALPIENLEPIPEPALIEPVAAKTPVVPKQPILPQKEIELRSLTPAVKSVEIHLRGSIREQKVLDDIHAMVSEILQTSRLSVIRIPVVEDATTTPAIKLYEHLEVTIHASSPEQVGQPYLIQISFQEKNSSQNVQQRSFEYVDSNPQQFYTQLRAYMNEHMNLSPRYQTIE